MANKVIQILINAKDEASSVFDGLKGKVVALGGALAAYLGVNAFAGMVSGASDLEQGMSRVQAATGATAEEMAALRKAAEEAGANTRFTSIEAAGALENLAKAGLNAAEAIDALPAVLSLAQAADIGLAESSEILTKATMGLGLAFTESGRVADVLAKGANATNTSITGLAQALSYAAPVASSLGLSLETTVAIMGKFADAGIDASRAGTALNSILSQFANPASKFRQELAAAGITTGDFEEALRQLAEAGPAGSKAIIAVGQEAGPALRALLNQGIGALDELKGKLLDAQGSAAATAKVMEDNLNGSMRGLGSAWEAVKNALGTPVLPVLKEGVDQLAGAFRNAVADGTVGRFGESIATAFQNGVKFVRDFLSTVNFDEVLTRMQGFADSANETLAKAGEYATSAGNTVKLAYGAMSAGVNGVLTAIYGIGSVFAEVASSVMSGVAKLREGLASVTFGALSESFRLAAEDARSAAEGFGDAAQAMRDKAAQSFGDTARAAQTARNGFAGLVGSVGQVAPVADTASKAIADMARQIDAAGQKAAAAKKATDDKKASDEAAAASIRQLRQEYSDLVASGSIQAAAEKLQQINKALAGTPPVAADAARAAAQAAEQIEAAFQRLGVTSSAELKRQAESAARDYDTVRNAGTSTAQDIAAAFKVAAQAAIDANKGIAPSWVTAQAGARGYRVEVDAAGKSTVVAMRDAAAATDRVRQAAGGAAGGYRDMAGAAEQAAASAKKLQEIYDRNKVGNGSNLVGKSGDVREAAVMQYDINQDIAKRYGDAAVGNELAEQAWQLRQLLQSYQRNYGGARSRQSLLQQRNIAAELERVEAELKGTLGGGGGSSGPAERPPPAGPSTGQPTVVNITLDGARHSINTDAAGARAIQDLIRQLNDDKGRA